MASNKSTGAETTKNEILESILKYVVMPVKEEKIVSKDTKVDKELEELLFSKKLGSGNSLEEVAKKLIESINSKDKKSKNDFWKGKSLVLEETVSIEHNKKRTVVQYNSNNGNSDNEFEKSGQGYSVSVEYESNETQEAIKITVSDYSKPGEVKNLKKKDPKEKKSYQILIRKEHDEIQDSNYSIKAVYETNYEQERLSIQYDEALQGYLEERNRAFHDFTDRVPGKKVDVFPESIMGGVLGFTYLGDDYMALREDIRDDTSGEKLMVDVHESIHTPDEYETRILTDWILQRKASDKYVR